MNTPITIENTQNSPQEYPKQYPVTKKEGHIDGRTVKPQYSISNFLLEGILGTITLVAMHVFDMPFRHVIGGFALGLLAFVLIDKTFHVSQNIGYLPLSKMQIRTICLLFSICLCFEFPKTSFALSFASGWLSIQKA